MIIIPEIMSFFKFLLNPLRKMLPSVAFAMNAARLSDKNDASPREVTSLREEWERYV